MCVTWTARLYSPEDHCKHFHRRECLKSLSVLKSPDAMKCGNFLSSLATIWKEFSSRKICHHRFLILPFHAVRFLFSQPIFYIDFNITLNFTPYSFSLFSNENAIYIYTVFIMQREVSFVNCLAAANEYQHSTSELRLVTSQRILYL